MAGDYENIIKEGNREQEWVISDLSNEGILSRDFQKETITHILWWEILGRRKNKRTGLGVVMSWELERCGGQDGICFIMFSWIFMHIYNT